jgi:hypothetical protein
LTLTPTTAALAFVMASMMVCALAAGLGAVAAWLETARTQPENIDKAKR